MKNNRNLPIVYNINDKESLARLEKDARFKHINHFIGGQGKRYQALFRTKAFSNLLKQYQNPPVEVAQIALLGANGLGAIATEDIVIKKGKQKHKLGIYWGKLNKEGNASSLYIFTVANYEIDANKHGNWTRFVNHSQTNYNITAFERKFKCGSKYLPYIEYAATKTIKKGEQLLVNYGPLYGFDEKKQIFINPSNSYVSSADLFSSYSKLYSKLPIKIVNACAKIFDKAKIIYAPTYLIKLLSSSRALPNKTNLPENMPLLAAKRVGHVLPDNKQAGLTSLMVACYLGHVKAVEVLIKKYHENVNQQNTMNGCTPLHYTILSSCSLSNKAKILKLLMNANVQLEAQDKSGLTALHWCVATNNFSLMKLMFSHKKSLSSAMAALDAKSYEGFTPITSAMLRGDVEMTDYLLTQFEKLNKKRLFIEKFKDLFLPATKLVLKINKIKFNSEMFQLLMAHGLFRHHNIKQSILLFIRKHNGGFYEERN